MKTSVRLYCWQQ